MLINPNDLKYDLPRLESIEKASLRLVVQALLDYQTIAEEIFREESDLVSDIGEDITREALDRMGMAKIDQRLFGKIDYKRARYVFQPEFAVKQALFVDSKAEKIEGRNTATLQTSQFSMTVRQMRAGQLVEVQGGLPTVLIAKGHEFITTTIFVKYNYNSSGSGNILQSIVVSAVPNGFLQDKYNPTAEDTIWLAGRNAPSLGEAFRVRLSFKRLEQKARWRVQRISLTEQFLWDE